MSQPLAEHKLELEQLGFERQYRYLFKEVSSTLQKGELLEIRGANGSGKSTLLRILAGLLEPHEGRVLWKNQSIARERDTYSQHRHYLGHLNGIKANLTVAENLQLYCALNHMPFQETDIRTILETLKLQSTQQKYVAALSAGQRRRLALARLLVNRCALWILDEPTTALDTEGQGLFDTLLTEHLSQGGIAVIATHHPLTPRSRSQTLTLGVENA